MKFKDKNKIINFEISLENYKKKCLWISRDEQFDVTEKLSQHKNCEVSYGSSTYQNQHPNIIEDLENSVLLWRSRGVPPTTDGFFKTLIAVWVEIYWLCSRPRHHPCGGGPFIFFSFWSFHSRLNVTVRFSQVTGVARRTKTNSTPQYRGWKLG